MPESSRWIIKYPEKPNFKDIHWGKYVQFKASWEFSFDKLQKINKELNKAFGENNNFSVLVAGSFGRLDAHQKSDLDFMVIHNGHLEGEDEKVNTIREIAETLGIGLPNPNGAFSRPVPLDDIIKKIGSREDDLHSTAQRMLILMECRPIYNNAYFSQITTAILNHYLDLVQEEKEKEALVLLNDLIKYFRLICLNVEFSFWQDEEKEKWGLRNVKLRHSRVMIYTGLLFLILNSSKKRADKIDYLQNKIHLSPLEKIYSVYNSNNDYNFERVIGAYNNFLNKLAREDVREELKSLEYKDRYMNYNYAALKTNSDFLQSELTRFILDNRINWTSKIVEYLFF